MADTQKDVKHLRAFIDAVQVEFWQNRREEYAAFCSLLGARIKDVQNGEIVESEYVKKWDETKLPGV